MGKKMKFPRMNFKAPLPRPQNPRALLEFFGDKDFTAKAARSLYLSLSLFRQ